MQSVALITSLFVHERSKYALPNFWKANWIRMALQQHVKGEIDGVVSKYAERPTDAIIVFSKSGHEFVCEATIHLSTGLTAQARSHEMKYMHHLIIVQQRWKNNYVATKED